MPDTPNGLLGLIQSGWTQITAIVGIIWWSRNIDLRTKDHADRLDRHDARLRGIEQQAQAQAILQARIEEALMNTEHPAHVATPSRGAFSHHGEPTCPRSPTTSASRAPSGFR